jgi:hypothetical protein
MRVTEITADRLERSCSNGVIRSQAAQAKGPPGRPDGPPLAKLVGSALLTLLAAALLTVAVLLALAVLVLLFLLFLLFLLLLLAIAVLAAALLAVLAALLLLLTLEVLAAALLLTAALILVLVVHLRLLTKSPVEPAYRNNLQASRAVPDKRLRRRRSCGGTKPASASPSGARRAGPDAAQPLCPATPG